MKNYCGMSGGKDSTATALKICSKCGMAKPFSEFYYVTKFKDRLQYACKLCRLQEQRRLRKERRDSGKMSYESLSYRRRKVVVFKHYGGENPQCACCGERRSEFLSIDHIKGGGTNHLREILKTKGQLLYRWLIHQGFPSGFRVLCHNCNQSRGLYGYCPHEDELGRMREAESAGRPRAGVRRIVA